MLRATLNAVLLGLSLRIEFFPKQNRPPARADWVSLLAQIGGLTFTYFNQDKDRLMNSVRVSERNAAFRRVRRLISYLTACPTEP